MRNKCKRILTEIHLYSDKMEMLIKFIIWVISWIGGIVVLQTSQQKETMGSAYFIFSLSLLMEFAPKIKGKREFWSKFFHTIFCLSILLLLCMAITLVLGIVPPKEYYVVMFVESIFILVYMLVDLVVLWLSSEDIEIDNVHLQQQGEALAIYKRTVFEDKLVSGNLGNIEKGVKKDE